MSAALRIAVVGVGHLGQHHARLLASMDGVQLVGIVDTKPGRAGEIASKLGVPSFTHLGELPLDGLDAVTIAVPTVSHLDVALPLIDAGVSVLVEKPLSSSLGDADKMIESAARRGVVLAAGHTERFNPAVVAALPLVSNPRFIEVHRLGTFPERSLDIDVIFDLMIHDLDLLLTSVKSEVVSIEAIGVNVLTPKTDIANVRLRFESGCIANVTASRISRDKIRKVRFFQRLRICQSTTRRRRPRFIGWLRTMAGRRSKAGSSTSSAMNRCARSWPISSGRSAIDASLASADAPGATRWRWRRRSQKRWKLRQGEL